MPPAREQTQSRSSRDTCLQKVNISKSVLRAKPAGDLVGHSQQRSSGGSVTRTTITNSIHHLLTLDAFAAVHRSQNRRWCRNCHQMLKLGNRTLLWTRPFG